LHFTGEKYFSSCKNIFLFLPADGGLLSPYILGFNITIPFCVVFYHCRAHLSINEWLSGITERLLLNGCFIKERVDP